MQEYSGEVVAAHSASMISTAKPSLTTRTGSLKSHECVKEARRAQNARMARKRREIVASWGLMSRSRSAACDKWSSSGGIGIRRWMQVLI